MAKFIYRMQNILNIKYKLEESAKQEYAEARQALSAEEQKLDALKERSDIMKRIRRPYRENWISLKSRKMRTAWIFWI